MDDLHAKFTYEGVTFTISVDDAEVPALLELDPLAAWSVGRQVFGDLVVAMQQHARTE